MRYAHACTLLEHVASIDIVSIPHLVHFWCIRSCIMLPVYRRALNECMLTEQHHV